MKFDNQEVDKFREIYKPLSMDHEETKNMNRPAMSNIIQLVIFKSPIKQS
jgi:hypothetical protein